jgi:general secretion pathway protein E
MPLVDKADFPDEVQDECDIAQRFLKKNNALVLSANDEDLVVAMADPLDGYVIEALSLVSGRNVIPRVGVPSDIEAALDSLYEASGKEGSIGGGGESARYLDDVEQLKELAGEAPVISRSLPVRRP